ncbi:MAG: glycoside hydrolase family 30 protein [Bacteroidota bacterium]|nr:glycoside hydrolase family 30 protein [Bacteroidota bacterium]
MKKLITLKILMILSVSLSAQAKVEWISTSQQQQWKEQKGLMTSTGSANADVELQLSQPQQTMEGFGTCFNELGWTSLSMLRDKDRESIMKELFAPGIGASFTICRMPVGANDFSRNWYSYDETDGDFDMKHFSIANDLKTLIPFIKNAQKYNSSLKLWASPWSPPTWMKYNKHYAARSVLGNVNFKSDEFGMDLTGINNGLPSDKEGKEGTDMFVQEEKYYRAYALYFARFIQAYRQQKIKIAMVMPQNEFNSAQPFPSCTWTAAGLARFISYLGPQMQALGVNVFFGTVERANEKLVDTILTDPGSSRYIKGAGFQWAGKGAIAAIHRQYPGLTLYQSEQECGNGKNDWKYCVYTWSLMKHYLKNGANAYFYWNTCLRQGGISTWGWKQNSLVSVDTINKTYTYNYEYYLMKHLSHFVKPGAKRLNTTGSFDNLLAFMNPDKSVVIVIQNDSNEEKKINIKMGDKAINPSLKPNTFNTFLVK